MTGRLGHDRDAELIALDAELRRLARRADRQRRQMKRSPTESQRWSTTIDAGLTLVARIDRAPAHDLTGLAVKFRAVLWRIHADEDVIMDEAVRRALQRFGRDMARLSPP